MHQAAITHGREHQGERNFIVQYLCAQVGLAHGDRLPRAECHRFEGAAVLLQRDLTLGATVEIIEDHFWYTPLRKTPKVFDIDYSRRSHFACRPGHSSISHRARRRFCASLWYRRKTTGAR